MEQKGGMGSQNRVGLLAADLVFEVITPWSSILVNETTAPRRRFPSLLDSLPLPNYGMTMDRLNIVTPRRH